MGKLAMCRICLANDIPMLSIVNKCLQEMYEVLTKLPFVTDDSRPMLVCYICCARLHNSYKLAKSCLQSEELFQQMLNTDASSSVSLQQFSYSRRFGITHAVHIGYSSETCVEEGQSSVLFDVDVEVKQEIIEDFTNETSEEIDIKPEEFIQSCGTNYTMFIDTPTLHSENKTVNESEIDATNCIKTESCDDYKDFDDIIRWSDTESESLTVQNPSQNILLNSTTNASQTCDHTWSGGTDEHMESSAAQSVNIEDKSRKHKISNQRDSAEETSRNKATKSEFKQISAHNYVTALNIKTEPSTSASTQSVVFKKKKAYKRRGFSVKNEIKKAMKSFQCNICKKAFKDKSHLVDHIRIHTGEKPFECDVCKKRFTLKSSLVVHTRTHTGETPFKCDVCKKSFKQKVHLLTHARRHTGENPFQCDVCNKFLCSKNALIRHRLIHTRNNKPHECNKSFHDGKGLMNHARLDIGEKIFECDVCKKRFLGEKGLMNHVRMHTGKKNVECDVCKKKFLSEKWLMKHVRMHTGEKPFECDVCKKRFLGEKGLMNHVLMHTGEKPFECDVCKKRFLGEKGLMNHVRLHTGEKPFECDVCKKSFSLKTLLVRHLRIHSGINSFECDLCKRRFNLKHNFLKHYSTHTGEKPFECDVCKRRYIFKPNLIRHQKREKIFKCNLCDKNFCNRFDLYSHSISHNGYECDICKKYFIKRESLRAHTRIHTKANECDVCKKCYRDKSILVKHYRTHTGEK